MSRCVRCRDCSHRRPARRWLRFFTFVCRWCGHTHRSLTRQQFGRASSRLVVADNLAEAKRKHGWTREMYVTLSVRRARLSDAHLPAPTFTKVES